MSFQYLFITNNHNHITNNKNDNNINNNAKVQKAIV